MSAGHDVIVVGTGFASSFFLLEYLARAPADARVLVLERGAVRTHAERLADWRDDTRRREAEAAASIRNETPEKPWVFSLGFGGGSGCWWACTPRMLPADFELASRYGVGRDWPLGYSELEPDYARAEQVMMVAGSERAPYPRSGPCPLPPHRLSAPDRLLARHHPDAFFPQPAARPTRSLPSGRPRCCASGVCGLCPIDSKFTVMNELAHLYRDERVELRLEARAEAVDLRGGTATGVHYVLGGRERRAAADLVVLGANAIFNSQLLLRSGLEHAELGRGLVEQSSIPVDVDLAGLEGFDGSSSISGLGYMLYDGAHRKQRAAAMIESSNVPQLRSEPGRWRERMQLKVVIEDLRSAESRVWLDGDDPRPRVSFAGVSDYAQRTIDALPELLPRALSPLPVEKIAIWTERLPTEAHVMGTTPMDRDAARGVVDADLRCHAARNLLVLGSSVFPTAAPANPTLTLSALALRAARRLFT